MKEAILALAIIGGVVDVQTQRAEDWTHATAAAANATKWEVRGIAEQHAIADCSYCAWRAVRIAIGRDPDYHAWTERLDAARYAWTVPLDWWKWRTW